MKIVITRDELFELIKKAGINIDISMIEIINENGMPEVIIDKKLARAFFVKRDKEVRDDKNERI